MYKAMPEIRESAEELRSLMKQERHPQAHQRLHALSVVASAQARSRCAVASLLGVHRDTIGAWFALYEAGGRERVLDRSVSPGKASRVPPAVLEPLKQRLNEEEGVASYGAIQAWLAAQHGVQMQYGAVHHLVADHLKARPTVGRPRHRNKACSRDGVQGRSGGTDPRCRSCRLRAAG
jgi:transposase